MGQRQPAVEVTLVTDRNGMGLISGRAGLSAIAPLDELVDLVSRFLDESLVAGSEEVSSDLFVQLQGDFADLMTGWAEA